MPRLTCFGPRSASSSSCRVPSCPSQESICASLNVAAGHSRQGHFRVIDAGGSRRSYRNGRAKFCSCRGHPLSRGAPKVVGGGGVPCWHLSSSACAGLLPGLPQCLWCFPSGPIPHFQRVRSDQAHGHSRRLVRHACVACMGLPDLVLARCSQEARSGGRAPVCRKVARACSQPQSMFLHFETRPSGVGECAQRVRSRTKPRGVDSVPKCRT